MNKIELIDKDNLEAFSDAICSKHPLAYYFIKQYIVNGTKQYINNTEHEVMLGLVNDKAVPLIVNRGQDSQCYLTSPSVNYIKYAKDFILSIEKRGLRTILLWIICLVEKCILSRALDKVVYINNWAVATGPPLTLSMDEIDGLLDTLKTRFKGYAFVFKGIRQENINDYWVLIKNPC